MNYMLPVSLVAAWLSVGAMPDGAQGSQSSESISKAGQAVGSIPISRRLRRRIEQVRLAETAARDAFAWWSKTTEIPLIINWRTLEDAGIDADTPINLTLHRAPAGQVLSMMAKQLSLDPPLIYRPTRIYVELMTKHQANRRTSIRIYDIRDLLHAMPRYGNAPKFDLDESLSNTGSGGSRKRGSGSSGNTISVFGRTDDNEKEPRLTRDERAQAVADLIRKTIEPDIWIANGGRHASIRHFNSQLVIKAPWYAHQQIGLPSTQRIGRRSSSRVDRDKSRMRTFPGNDRPLSRGVSAVSGRR